MTEATGLWTQAKEKMRLPQGCQHLVEGYLGEKFCLGRKCVLKMKTV